MSDELTGAYRGTDTIRVRNGVLIESIDGAGSLYTNLGMQEHVGPS